MKTFGFLQRDDVFAGRVESTFRGDTREMMRAAVNPDHSAEAVKVVREMLEKKGVKGEEIEKFYTDWNEISVSRFGRVPTMRKALKRAGRWRRIYRTLQVVGLISLAGAIVCGVLSEMKVAGAEEISAAGTIMGMMVLVCLLGPGLRALIWRWPARILLLRPFGMKAISKDLKRLIRKNVAFRGHIFTLADQHMKESFWLWLLESIPKSEGELIIWPLYWLGLLDSPKRRLYIKKVHHYRMLKRRLASRWLLNCMWINSWDKIRKIRTTDAWWQRCVDLLAANCEVMLVDLTVVKSGTHWELNKISRQAMEGKSVFVVREDGLANAKEVLRGYWAEGTMPRIFSYNARGEVLEKGDFDERFAEILTHPRPVYTGKAKVSFWFTMTWLMGWMPLYGTLFPAVLWSNVSRSEGRLRGKWLSRVMLGINLGLLAMIVVLVITASMKAERRRQQYEAQRQEMMQREEAEAAADAAPNVTPPPSPAVETEAAPAVAPVVAPVVQPVAVETGPNKLLVPSQYAKIQDAIDAARSGDTVTVSAGDYAEQLVMKEGVKVEGDGMVTVKAAVMPALVIKDCGSGEVKGLTFDAGRAGGEEAVIAVTGSGVQLSGCTVENGLGKGIDISGAAAPGAKMEIDSSTIKDNAKIGVCVSGGATVSLTECNIMSDLDGIVADGSGTTCNAEKGYIENCSEDGISAQNGASLALSNVTVKSNAKYGCRIVGAGTTADVRDCAMSSNHDGLLISDQASGTVWYNTFTLNTGEGIYVYSGKADLNANTCQDNLDYGIVIGKDGGTPFETAGDVRARNTLSGNAKGDVLVVR